MADVYVITGGTGGIGIAIAKQFMTQGTILLADLDEDRLEEAAMTLQNEGATAIETCVTDVSDQLAVVALAEKAKALGSLKGLIHTAGLSPTLANWEQIVRVNAVGTAHILEAFEPLLLEGTVGVFIASMSAHLVTATPEIKDVLKNPYADDFLEKLKMMSNESSQGAYPFSKLAVIEMVKDRAVDWGEKGARLVSISPGTIDTAMARAEKEQSQQMAVMLEHTPLKREGRAEEIANVAAFLVSDQASYITGTDLLVDGGTIGNMPRIYRAMQND